MTNRRRTGKGQRGSLGAELGRGGEGIIYEVHGRPDLVAKEWIKPDEARARKLDALLRSRPSVPPQAANRIRLAWPQYPMYDKEKTVGFAMQRAERSRYREFITYSNPLSRGKLGKELGVSIGDRHLLGIARNVAEAFELVHKNGCLIGDVNHTNFLVSPDTSVFLIDVDSMQVPDKNTGEVYRCEVGTPDFTPPRLIGKRLSEIDRIPDDDHFGLAVLIFQLLMEGNHPYDPVDSAGSSESGNARLENVKRGHAPYTAMLSEHAGAWLTASEIPDPMLRQRMQQHILILIEGDSDTNYTALIDHRATAWLGLNSELQELFRRAFPNDQANDSPSRPTPREWMEGLEGAGAAMPAPAAPPVPRSLPLPAAGAHRRLYAPTQSATLLWEQKIGYIVRSSPAVVDGVVYVGSSDKHVYALDAANGDVTWKYKTDDAIESSPAVVNDVVYIGSNDKHVYALDTTKIPRRRQRRWRYPTSGAVRSSPTVENGVVYVGSSDRNVYALDTAKDMGGWVYKTRGVVRSSPTVVNGVVYVGSYDKYVYALDAVTGDEIWKYPTRGRVESSPTVMDGVVYVGSNDKRVYALDAKTGRHMWDRGTGRVVRSSPAVEDGVVYVGSSNKHVYALDAKTKRLVWRSPIGGGVWSATVVAHGVVYVGSADGHVYALDATTGDVRWRCKVGHDALSSDAARRSSPALSSRGLVNGVLYVGSNDGYVRALRVAEPRQAALPNPPTPTTPNQATTPTKTLPSVSMPKRADTAKEIPTLGLYTPDLTHPVKPGDLLWRHDLSFYIHRSDPVMSPPTVASSPTVVDGELYVGSPYGIYSFNVADNDLPKGMMISYSGGHRIKVLSSPTLTDGILYFGTLSKYVYAKDTTDWMGAEMWEYETGGEVISSPAVANGVVYIGSSDRHVYALNAATGRTLWAYETDGRVWSSPEVVDGSVYVGSNDGHVYKLNAATGRRLWKRKTGGWFTDGRVNSSPTVVNGVVYVGSYDKHLHALDADTGRRLWKQKTGAEVISSPAVVNGVVYVGSNDGYVYALDIATGRPQWTYETGAEVISSPAVVNGIVYVGSRDSYAYALDVNSGALVWKYKTSAEILSSPAVVNGVVYIGAYDENMYLYALAAGPQP